MPEGFQSLLVTIGVMASCIVFLSKQAVEAYRKSKMRNGKAGLYSDSCAALECNRLVKDLHNWHCPIKDNETGQPKFPWYENNAELLRELCLNREAMEELRDCMRKIRSSIDKLTAALERERKREQV